MLKRMETSRLIDEVKKRPLIWDPRSRFYKDNAKRAEQWMEICRTLYPGLAKKGEFEEKRKVRELQTRFKSLRDSYTKYLKKLRGPEGGEGLKRYVFADKLSFLKSMFPGEEDDATRSDDASSGNDPHEYSTTFEIECDEEDEEEDAEAMIDSIKFEPPLSDDAPDSPNCSRSPPPEERKRDLRLDLKKRPPRFRKRRQDNIQDDIHDSDKAFFSSLLPTLQNFSEDQKLEFRTEVLLLVRKIRAGGADSGTGGADTSSSTSSWKNILKKSDVNEGPHCNPFVLLNRKST
ncbi:dihydrouridine synthase domain containing protein [Plakobranchus ocellatus]|uniref:Dihydrouridine synthase domain containing protein n=1 Tax=Plakobranchus ocellatus TaxID=259542 RepID=A0AAV4DLB8_9GAST|nr:dihydrouridine synthase domain containing protein [Plakobranchus ocellatus]